MLIFASKWLVVAAIILIPSSMFIMGVKSEFSAYITSIISIILFTLPSSIYFKSDVLVPSLPLNKYEIVLSKYIEIFLNYIVVNLYLFFSIWILKTLGVDIQFLSIEFLKLTLLISVISLSVLLPVVLFYSSMIGSLMLMVTMTFILRFIEDYLFNEGSLIKANIDNLIIVNNPWINIAIFILMVISILISLKKYSINNFIKG